MRAGLLSDPRVVALLREKFVPCMMSALNTKDRISDPRDAELLASFVRPGGEPFVGGEREVFLTPDGEMLDVFLSLHGPDRGGQLHMTRTGRRSDAASAMFFTHAEAALAHGGGKLPADWAAFRDGSATAVQDVLLALPQWPLPAAGEQALRVFSRSGHHAYDELHGCELVPLTVANCGLDAMAHVGATTTLPAAQFLALVRAMVPRGGVDTCLADDSIGGELTARTDTVTDELLTGTWTGRFTMRPTTKAEVSRRENAASLFTATGTLRGQFTFDRRLGRIRQLRIACVDGTIDWLLPWQEQPERSHHMVAIEWVLGESSVGAAKWQFPCENYRRGLRGRGNFGLRITGAGSPFTGSWHLAEDVWLPAGTPVVAVADGIVRYSDFSPSWRDDRGQMHWNLGNVIVLEHALAPPVDGLTHVCSFYVHLGADRRVQVGERVVAGQRIGTIGKDRSEENGLYAAHLHFGLHRGAYVQVAPSFVRELQAAAQSTGIVFGPGEPIRGTIEITRVDPDTVLVRGQDGASVRLSLLVGSSAPGATCADIMHWCKGYGDEATVAEWLRPSEWLARR